MTAPYRTIPIAQMATLEIRRGDDLAGYVFPPRGPGELWEVAPTATDTGRLPDGDRGYVARRFPDEGAALAFLGIDHATTIQGGPRHV